MEVDHPADTWAVIISASIHWHNYRHLGNAVNIYDILRSRGIPASNIIFLNALDVSCNPRNVRQGSIYTSSQPPFKPNEKSPSHTKQRIANHTSTSSSSKLSSKYHYKRICDNIFDYQGNEANVESFLRLLYDIPSSSHRSKKRLLSHQNSSLLLFLSGHGGDGFFKFRDQEELSSLELASAIASLHRRRRYKQLLVMVDTCQAQSMYQHIRAPGVLFIGSSRTGENSFAYSNHPELGVAYIDRFTYNLVDFFNKHHNHSRSCRASSLLRHLTPELLYSHPVFFSSNHIKPDDVDLRSFFGPMIVEDHHDTKIGSRQVVIHNISRQSLLAMQRMITSVNSSRVGRSRDSFAMSVSCNMMTSSSSHQHVHIQAHVYDIMAYVITMILGLCIYRALTMKS